MAPLRGWCLKGQRLIGHAPSGQWNTMTFLAALRHDRITAPFLLDDPIDQVSFLTYIETILSPTLRPGDIVIADDLACHKPAAVRRDLRTVGARLRPLPTYFTDLNPIEQVFAKLKHLLRKAAARTRDAVCITIGNLLTTYSPQECFNYLIHSGYHGRNVITL